MLHKPFCVVAALIWLAGGTLVLSGRATGADGRADLGLVTFSRDVAPVLFGKCVQCHRPGQPAPMSLLMYKDARPWARSIKEKVVNRTMPPWHADPAVEKFDNDRSLSKQEIATIVAWVDGGAHEGDPRDLPPVPQFADGWKIGKPDAVFTMPVKFDVPAQGVLDYKYFSVPTHFAEDRWVQAAEVRAGRPAVVHHVIVFVQHPRQRRGEDQPGSGDQRRGKKLGQEPDRGLESIAGVAPGEEPSVWPDGTGFLLRAGSVLLFQMHYTPYGVAQSDQTSVGFVFNKTPVVKAVMGGAAVNADFAIPPGEPNYEIRSSDTIDEDSHLTSLMPHMHVRGKDFQYRLVYPDGTSKTLLSVPRYDFNWQTNYRFAKSVAAPRGSRIECVAHFDNSAGNKTNPDPTKLVRWGPQTWDEMMIGFFEYTLDHQDLRLAQSPKSAADPAAQKVQQPPVSKADAGTGSTESLPAVAQILDKYIEAIGGKAAIQAQTSRVRKGRLKVPSFGAEGTIEIYAKAPNKELVEIASPFLGSSRTGFNGTAAWEEEDGQVKDLSAYPKRDADFYLPIKLAELHPLIEVKAKEKVGGRQAYRLEAPRGGRPKQWYFDSVTGLLIRTEVRDAGGKLVRSQDYEDYRQVDGIRLPFSVREVDEDGTEILITFREIKHKVVIDDARFEKPAAKAPG